MILKRKRRLWRGIPLYIFFISDQTNVHCSVEVVYHSRTSCFLVGSIISHALLQHGSEVTDQALTKQERSIRRPYFVFVRSLARSFVRSCVRLFWSWSCSNKGLSEVTDQALTKQERSIRRPYFVYLFVCLFVCSFVRLFWSWSCSNKCLKWWTECWQNKNLVRDDGLLGYLFARSTVLELKFFGEGHSRWITS